MLLSSHIYSIMNKLYLCTPGKRRFALYDVWHHEDGWLLWKWPHSYLFLIYQLLSEARKHFFEIFWKFWSVRFSISRKFRPNVSLIERVNSCITRTYDLPDVTSCHHKRKNVTLSLSRLVILGENYLLATTTTNEEIFLQDFFRNFKAPFQTFKEILTNSNWCKRFRTRTSDNMDIFTTINRL